MNSDMIYVHRVKVGSGNAKRHVTYVYTCRVKAAEQFELLGGRMRTAKITEEWQK